MKTSSSILAGMILVVLVVDVVHVVADIHGCTRFSAQNYNENATIDDDSCQCNCQSGTGSCPVDDLCPGQCPVEAECPNGETVQGCAGQNLCPVCGSEPVGKVFAVDKSAGTPCFSLDCSECFVPITCDSFDCSSEATNTANKGSGTACSGTCDANTCCESPQKYNGLRYFKDNDAPADCTMKYFAQLFRTKGADCRKAAKKYMIGTMTKGDACSCCKHFSEVEVDQFSCELHWDGFVHDKKFNFKDECDTCPLGCSITSCFATERLCTDGVHEDGCPVESCIVRDMDNDLNNCPLSSTPCPSEKNCGDSQSWVVPGYNGDGCPLPGHCEDNVTECSDKADGTYVADDFCVEYYMCAGSSVTGSGACGGASGYMNAASGACEADLPAGCRVGCSSSSCPFTQKLCIDGADADGCAVEICVDRDIDINNLLCPIENTTCPSEKSCGDGHSWVSAGMDARGCPLPGMCEVDEIHGCTRPSAFNYNENATVDDDSCECNCQSGTGSCPVDGICPGTCPVEAACPNGATVQGCPGQQLCPVCGPKGDKDFANGKNSGSLCFSLECSECFVPECISGEHESYAGGPDCKIVKDSIGCENVPPAVSGPEVVDGIRNWGEICRIAGSSCCGEARRGRLLGLDNEEGQN